MNIIQRIKNAILRALGREIENKVEREVHNAFNKNAKSETSVQQTTVEPNTQASSAETSNAELEMLRKQNEAMAQAMAAQAMANGAAKGGSSLKDVNEMMSYFEFDKEMNIVGVKPDAPEWVKLAYENREKE